MIFTSLLRRILFSAVAMFFIASTASAELTHRYSFNDGTAKDSAGKIDGTLKGEAKIADGKLVLANGEKTSGDSKLAYLDFGAAIIPKSGSVSLAVWITAKENPSFSRVLDIGDSDNGEGAAFIYLVPRHDEDKSRAAITATDTGGKTYSSGDRLDDDKPHLAVLVIDGAAKKLRFYVDGKESAAEDLTDNTLDKVKPVHNWLGRSGFDADPGLSASIDEFRVYDHALGKDEVEAIQKAGPDAVPAKP